MPIPHPRRAPPSRAQCHVGRRPMGSGTGAWRLGLRAVFKGQEGILQE